MFVSIRRLMTMLLLVAGVVLDAAAQDAPGTEVAQKSRANVVLFILDDVGFGDLSVHGNRLNETPNIDRLFRTGVNFRAAYAASPVGAPSRASMLIGKTPEHAGITNYIEPIYGKYRRSEYLGKPIQVPESGQDLLAQSTTFAELLKREGYRTGWVGKWNLNGGGPTAHGFDRADYASKWDELRYMLEGYYLDNYFGDHIAARVTRAATRFIEDNREQPFLLVVSHIATHMPLQPPAEKLQYFTDKMGKGVRGEFENPAYAAALSMVDDSIGAIYDKVDQFALAGKTLFIVVSDNGGLVDREYFIGDYFEHSPATDLKPLRGGKGWLYEGGLRIPMALNWAGLLPTGISFDTPVIITDLFPTVLAAAGLRGYQDHFGANLFDIIVGVKPDRELMWNYPHYSRQGGKPGSAIRDGRYKLIQWHETGSAELYDLVADPSETENLLPAMSRQGKKMAEELVRWLLWTRSSLPRRDPPEGATKESAPEQAPGSEKKSRPPEGNPYLGG